MITIFLLCVLAQDPNWKDWQPKSRPTITTVDSERTDRRKVTVNGVRYVVVFDIGQFATVPATNPPGQTHYKADITIFQVGYKTSKGSTATTYTQIADTFRGEWTEYGCFEDDPKRLVEETLKRLSTHPKKEK